MSQSTAEPTVLPLPTVGVPRCPVCGASAATILYGGLTDRVFGVAPGAWTLRRCTGCGTARLDPRPADEAIASLYAGYYTHKPPQPNIAPVGRIAAALRALRNAHVNRRLGYDLQPAWRLGRMVGRAAPPLAAIAERGVRSLPAGGRLLDVGCGNGEFVAEAAAAGWLASGIDLDASAVASGRAAGLDVSVETIEERATREPEAFDAVTLSHVIEHVADPIRFLRAAKRLLREGGLIWIATPNLGSVGHRVYREQWVHLDPPRHLMIFDFAGLASALRAAGFETVRRLRPTPAATDAFRVSEAIRRGICPANDAPGPAPSVRARSWLADGLAQLNVSRADELLVLASRA